MIKNFLETKTGRNFLIGVTVFFVVVLGLTSYSLFSNTANREETTKKGQTEETAESKERLGEYSATTYSGKWYSNRSDEKIQAQNAKKRVNALDVGNTMSRKGELSKLTDLTKHAIPKAARLTAENQRTIGGNTLTKGLQGQLLQAPVR